MNTTINYAQVAGPLLAWLVALAVGLVGYLFVLEYRALRRACRALLGYEHRGPQGLSMLIEGRGFRPKASPGPFRLHQRVSKNGYAAVQKVDTLTVPTCPSTTEIARLLQTRFLNHPTAARLTPPLDWLDRAGRG